MNVNFQQFTSLICENNNFIIVTHEKPDGDAVGSSLGLLETLLDNGKNATVYFPEAPPAHYQFLMVNKNIVIGGDINVENYELCLCLDTAASHRAAMWPGANVDDIALKVFNIDHHPDNRMFGHENLVLPDAAATSEIIYRLCENIDGWNISKQAGTALLSGLIMDTGAFRFDNTSPRIFNLAAELSELSGEYRDLIQRFFYAKPLKQVKFESELISSRLRSACDERYVWLFLDDEILSKYQIDLSETEGLIDAIRVIKDVDVVALLYRRGDGVKFSLRSKDPRYSVASVARTLNGGGHEMAAGGLVKTSDEELAQQILAQEIQKLLC